jgi:hypothetical protein
VEGVLGESSGAKLKYKIHLCYYTGNSSGVVSITTETLSSSTLDMRFKGMAMLSVPELYGE